MFNWVNEIQNIKKDLATSETVLNAKIANKTTAYIHHFDVNLSHENLSSIPEGSRVDLNFNVISNTETKYTKLSDIDGDGYIISAFGLMYQGDTPLTTYVFDAKLFYKALNGGTLLLNINDITNGTIACAVVTALNNYAITDSVNKV